MCIFARLALSVTVILSCRTPVDSDEDVEARKAAAHRQRSLIFNNDGDDALHYGKMSDKPNEPASKAGLLSIRMDHIGDCGLDSVFYCTTQSFNSFTHDSPDYRGLLDHGRGILGEPNGRSNPVGDDIAALAEQIMSLNLRLLLVGLEADAGTKVSVEVNGTDIPVVPEKAAWLSGEVPPSAMKHGGNTVSVVFESGSTDALKLASIELAVKYKQ
jgi:hypothetical protein